MRLVKLITASSRRMKAPRTLDPICETVSFILYSYSMALIYSKGSSVPVAMKAHMMQLRYDVPKVATSPSGPTTFLTGGLADHAQSNQITTLQDECVLLQPATMH